MFLELGPMRWDAVASPRASDDEDGLTCIEVDTDGMRTVADLLAAKELQRLVYNLGQVPNPVIFAQKGHGWTPLAPKDALPDTRLLVYNDDECALGNVYIVDRDENPVHLDWIGGIVQVKDVAYLRGRSISWWDPGRARHLEPVDQDTYLVATAEDEGVKFLVEGTDLPFWVECVDQDGDVIASNAVEGIVQIKDVPTLKGREVGWWCPDDEEKHLTSVDPEMYIIPTTNHPAAQFCVLDEPTHNKHFFWP